MASRGAVAIVAGIALSGAFSALAAGCLERRETDPAPASEGRCASCHGDATRSGDFLQRSAPPSDLLQADAPGYPGVGAHLVHLYATDTHGAVLCGECHVVPETTQAPGHADDARPAEVVFGGPIGAQSGRAPAYDFVTRRCSDTYCHGQADAIWTAPKSSADACGSCHGLPPPAPHPQSSSCEVCHGAVIDSDRRFTAPEHHVDGVVQLGGPTGCVGCHGAGDSPAPPPDVRGNTDVAAIGVGAHQAHVTGGRSGRAVACNACHVVPENVDSPGHADALPAEVRFADVAVAGARVPAWDRAATSCSDTWCHGPSPASLAVSPSWVAPDALGCTGCHGAPPPAPHPQDSDCSRCHGAVVGPDDTSIVNRNRHVDGIVDVSFDQGCTACHGGESPAPPPDLAGSTSTSSPGVGAHRTHVQGTTFSRGVPCGECHRVPDTVFEPGHIDTLPPAEVAFSGAAVAFGAAPVYAAGSCQGTPCHGAVFPDGHASGGSNLAPLWTRVDGSQAACGACHGLPPPAPHPRGDLNPICNACHQNIAADNASFLRRELHVDGVVTFRVP